MKEKQIDQCFIKGGKSMARTIRKSTDNLEQMLQDLKIGEPPILDTESGYDICRVQIGRASCRERV